MDGTWDVGSALKSDQALLGERPESQIQKAYNAAIATGYRSGAPSGNAVGFLAEMFSTMVIPLVQTHLPLVLTAIGDVYQRARAEDFSGVTTARWVTTVAATDALMKLLQTTPASDLDWSVLSSSEWLAIGLAFCMWIQTRSGLDELKSLLSAFRDE